MTNQTTTLGASVAPTATPTTDITRALSIITTAFAAVPLTNTFIVEIDGTPPPYPSPLITPARLHAHFAPGIQSGHAAGSTILQAGSFSAIAIWEPPDFAGAPFTQFGAAGPLRTAWRVRVEAAKAKVLQGRPFWHLAFLARDSGGSKVAGAVSAVVKPVLEEARKAETPVWLEAVDERGVAIYGGWGFELVDHVVLGAGTHGKSGWPEVGGEGVSGYCMVYQPWVGDREREKEATVGV